MLHDVIVAVGTGTVANCRLWSEFDWFKSFLHNRIDGSGRVSKLLEVLIGRLGSDSQRDVDKPQSCCSRAWQQAPPRSKLLTTCFAHKPALVNHFSVVKSDIGSYRALKVVCKYLRTTKDWGIM